MNGTRYSTQLKDPVYDSIGTGYNTTRQADPYLLSRLMHLLGCERDGKYLDIGCGTGNYTVALANSGIDIVGLDPSKKMLEGARSRSSAITWLEGAAEQIPAKNESFDGIVATLTIHHWSDINASFREIHRVLKPRGKAVFFTSTPAQMNGYWLNHYFPAMMRHSSQKMPSVEAISASAFAASLEIAATEKYFVKDDLKDMFLHAGKNRPSLYFDEKIRAGISSFALFSVRSEVEEGLAKLKSDIDSGAFAAIHRRYENDLGDYLFVVFQKQ